MSQKRPLRILITNDDGYRAEGIKLLEDIARQLTDDVWVIAPAEQQSGKGHALTYRDPLRLKQLAEQRYCVNGTPTDCMIIGLRKLLRDTPPDFVLSGINNGENVAESITQSGTIGAAMEAVLHGIPAIALSQVTMESYPADWSVTKAHGLETLRHILKQTWDPNTLLNVNFPHTSPDQVAGIRVCRHGRRSEMGGMIEGIDPRGKPYYWVGVLHKETDPPEDTDLWGIINGYITVTPIGMDLTNYHNVGELTKTLTLEFDSDLRKTA